MGKIRYPLCFGLCIYCFLAAPVFAAGKPMPPNIVFLFADDLGWGDVGVYGGRKKTTPSLDKLASEGMLFTQFYVPGPVCSPSRAGIMTGQAPARHRIYGQLDTHEKNAAREMPDSLDPSVTTLTDLLAGAGYATAHFGKWHLGSVPPSRYGVNVYRTDNKSSLPAEPRLDIWSASARPTATYEILKAALAFIRNHQHEPFYVNAWFSDPHATLNPSLEQLGRVPDLQPRGVSFFGAAQVYYAAVMEMDNQIGWFLKELEKLGLSDNTLVLFSSDNGPEDFQIRNAAHSGVGSAGPFRGRKRSLYEGGIRTPFIVRWPGKVPAGVVNADTVLGGVDLLPTLGRIAGVDMTAKPDLDGEDMSDTWFGNRHNRSTPLFWEWRYAVYGHVINRSPRLAVRDGDWKLLMNPDRSRMELYNIPADPTELTNLALQQPEVAENLARKLLSWNGSLPESPVDAEVGNNTYKMPGDDAGKEGRND